MTTSDRFTVAQQLVQLYDSRLDQLRRIVGEFPEDKLWQRPQAGLAALGNLVLHIAGSMRDWLENGVGQGNWQRNRQAEFDAQGGMDKQQLLAHLDQTRQHCDPFLRSIDQSSWNQPRTFRNQTFTAGQMLLRQLEHVAYHTGQAAFLRRLVANLPPTP